MLHFITSAPLDVARNTVHGAGFADPASDAPAWARAVVHVADRYALGVMSALESMGYEIAARRPARAAYGDPTSAQAMAAIERGA